MVYYTTEEAERVYDLCVHYKFTDNSLWLYRRVMEHLKSWNKKISSMQQDELDFNIKQVLKSEYYT
jgi:hypothetical protein